MVDKQIDVNLKKKHVLFCPWYAYLQAIWLKCVVQGRAHFWRKFHFIPINLYTWGMLHVPGPLAE